MFKKLSTPLKLTAILGLILISGLSVVWGATYHSSSRTVGASGGHIPINSYAEVNIPDGALSAYFAEQGISEVEITVEMLEIFNRAEQTLQGLIADLQAAIDNHTGAAFVPSLETAQSEAEAARDSLQNLPADTDAAESAIGRGRSSMIDALMEGFGFSQSMAFINQFTDAQVELAYGPDGLIFVFGPSGAHFNPPLELTIEACHLLYDNMMLFDENGEALEYQELYGGAHVVFRIRHFSEYSYDDYY